MLSFHVAKWRAAVALVLAPLCVGAQPSGPARSSADRSFERQFGDAFLDAYWKLNPDQAIAVGHYEVAERLVVPDEKFRTDYLAFLDRWQSRLHRIKPDALDDTNRTDWALLDNQFELERWFLDDYRSWEWDPSTYNVADPFALLLNTGYAPLDERLRTVLRRLENVPAYYAAAKQNVRSATREHTQLAIEQNRGALSVFAEDLERQIAGSKLTADERALFSRRLAAARAAIDDYVAWLQALDRELAQQGARAFRIGREMYDPKFAYYIQSGDTADTLYARALQEKERLLTRMEMLSDELWPKYFPNAAPPQDRFDKIGRLIGKLSEQHVRREDFFAEVKRQIPELQKWVTDHQLLDLDQGKPLEVRETPPYKRGVAIASIDAPGPYDPSARTYYNVTPLEELSPERAESFLREYNRWMLPILNIHEAVPGHYVQLVYSNKSPSRIKSIFGNGAMVEGWAVYAERMMLESGYGDHTAEMWLIYSKWNLRSVTNVILDYGVHVLGMTEEAAKKLLTREAFQSTEEANGKWRRAQLSSVQLTSYFSGYSAIYDFREQLKRELGEEFDLKRFHEQFLSYGSAPVKVIKELMRPTAR